VWRRELGADAGNEGMTSRGYAAADDEEEPMHKEVGSSSRIASGSGRWKLDHGTRRRVCG
jgi:hypothetical protein